MLTGNLEYLISSLPELSFSDSEQVQHDISSLFQKYASFEGRSEDLLFILNEESEKYLSTADFKRFRNIQLATIFQEPFQNSTNKVVSEFAKFSYQLKSEIRAYRMSKRSEEQIGKVHYELIGEIPKNPLKAEEYLLQLQWQQLEKLSIGHYSDLSALIVYKLKLQLLMRWWQFNEDQGFQVFQKSLNVA